MEINSGLNRLIQDPNQVYHNASLRGKGTKESPLKVSVDGLNIVVDGDTLTGDGTAEHPITIIPDCAILAEDGSPILTEEGEFLIDEECAAETTDIGYTSYVGRGEQNASGTEPPEIATFQNNTGHDFVWAYDGEGVYSVTAAGAFANAWCMISNDLNEGSVGLNFGPASDDVAYVLATTYGGVLTNGARFHFEVRIYPAP